MYMSCSSTFTLYQVGFFAVTGSNQTHPSDVHVQRLRLKNPNQQKHVFFSSAFPRFRLHVLYISWVVPLPSNSQQQDSHIFGRGSLLTFICHCYAEVDSPMHINKICRFDLIWKKKAPKTHDLWFDFAGTEWKGGTDETSSFTLEVEVVNGFCLLLSANHFGVGNLQFDASLGMAENKTVLDSKLLPVANASMFLLATLGVWNLRQIR